MRGVNGKAVRISWCKREAVRRDGRCGSRERQREEMWVKGEAARRNGFVVEARRED